MQDQSMSKYPRLSAYLRLMRFDKPIGTLLLLWPTLWALWLAARGIPDLNTLVIFIAGVIIMRAAGCVINDYADRHLDAHVARTKARPLATGIISERSALLLFAGLCVAAFGLVLLTNILTILLAFVGVALATAYPFVKRISNLPQVVLGLAFAWAIPMAYAAQAGYTTDTTWLLFIATACMTVAYDTYYGMVDKEDDLKIGIKSTAILFGQWDRHAIMLLQGATLISLLYVGKLEQLGISYYLGLGVMACLFCYQGWITQVRVPAQCFRAFLNNHWCSLAVWLGIAVSLL